MTTLAIAVDADDELWTLDALPTPEAPYVEVESELIEVRSRFPSSYYTLTGETLPPRIRVRRGIAGTTKASHIQGSTLTPNYGLGGGGAGAGGVTVTDGTTTVDPATSLSLPSGTVTDEGGGVASYAGGFLASTTDPGAIGAGAVWKDISGGPGLDAQWWERNVTNDGWDPAALMTVVAAAGATDVFVGAIGTSDDGDSTTQLGANVNGDGNALVAVGAHALGSGNAIVNPTAVADGAGDADAGSLASTISGTAFNYVLADRNGVQAGLNVEVGAGGPVITLLGLPTADPEVANAIYADGAPGPGAPVFLKISGGPA